MKYYTPLIWFLQCGIRLFNVIKAGINQNWSAMIAFILIIVLCIFIGLETISRNELNEKIKKLSEKKNESQQSNTTR